MHVKKVTQAVKAGFIAILINTIILKIAPLFHIQAESGGLLKLLISYLSPGLKTNTFVHSTFFWVVFHFIIGYSMVFLYVFPFRNWIRGSWLVKGGLFSLLPWSVNSFIVLPLLNQGLLGTKILSWSGIIYFFLANLIFGLLLSFFYEIAISKNTSYPRG